MKILDKINSSDDIKKLNNQEIRILCEELREFLIENISHTGGHLASNLGTVELTVAIHKVYDTAKDRLVFDVGHQSYTHKIITGRRDVFHTLRQKDGLSGFPKPYESPDDAFIAGHASNSVSVALGMAKARSLTKSEYDVVALIGDGALTGGLAFEGLAGAAASKEPMVIILNDNNMSIDPNVGGTASLLQNLRMKPAYISFKKAYRAVFGRIPWLYAPLYKLKEWLKTRVLESNVFTSMGLEYLGPVDGHDISQLENVLRLAKDIREPVVVHVLTKKGLGYKYAEEHPELYHGVGPFDRESGQLVSPGETFSDVFGSALCEYAEQDERIVGITAAMASGTGMDQFALKYPTRFVDTGIAEGHSVAMAAGLAKQGAIPVFAVYSSFLQRGYDMLVHDISLQNLHAVFCVDRAGIVGSDGETHHGVFDVNYLCSVPGMTVYCPASFSELRDMLGEALFKCNGPVAVRYPRGGEGEYKASCVEGESIVCVGSDVTVLCYGTMVNEALAAAKVLEDKGISVEIIKLGMIKPAGLELVKKSVQKTGYLIVPEDVCASGSIGRLAMSAIADDGIVLKGSKLINLGEGIVSHGKPAELFHDIGLDCDGIVSAVLEIKL